MFSSQSTISSNMNNLFQNSNNNQSSGLARYRSAPSSFLAALLDTNNNNNSQSQSQNQNQNHNTENSSSGDDDSAEAMMFSALLHGTTPDLNQKTQHGHQQYGGGGGGMKQEIVGEGGQNGYLGYESAVCGGGGSIVGSYSLGMDLMTRNVSTSSGGNSLVRQSSSPAGFFNGYGVMGEVGNYRVHNNHAEASSSANGLSNQINFSSCASSSSRFMPTIPENVIESPENGQLRNGNTSANVREFEPAFPHDPWNSSPINGLKRNRDGELKMFANFNALENQTGETRKSSSGLVHHMSMPKTNSEIAAAEKYLQFQQDAVPCQVRAKRGFATHPRSIAERVRRTRISEKMKKLQELFPDMDKQTNTADMLDMAVEYIKDLQKQVQTLTETKAKCVCPSQAPQTRPTT